MADPNSIDDLAKVGVGASGGGIVAIIGALISKFTTTAKLEQLDVRLAALDVKLQVLIAASEHRDNANGELDAERRLARLEALAEANSHRLDAMQRQLDGVVG